MTLFHRWRSVVTWIATIGVCACGTGLRSNPEPSESRADTNRVYDLDPTVSVRAVAPGLWVHVTIDPATGYPSNGMLLESNGESVLFDRAWDYRQTNVLLGWAASTLKKPVRRAVITHSHNDRLGGLGALRRAGVSAVALGATVERAAAEGLIASAARSPVPGGGVDAAVVLDSVAGLSRSSKRDAAGFELFFPGPGHSPDNVVVYYASSRVLFGGCLIKPDTATTTGNVADANVGEWPHAVARVAGKFPEAVTVVPGHGAVSSRAAFRVTQAIITEKGPAAVEALRRRQNRQP